MSGIGFGDVIGSTNYLEITCLKHGKKSTSELKTVPSEGNRGVTQEIQISC